ncbi:pectin acetylesterase 5-like [Panicum miliaceum]|uniref:Pectin acetylesterase n=1 Tax=Panicum miliaceum TaxID=4540 RepID=A0A3L6RI90_PANMI|nr:pectin acetylesterase 5-like [Panicum miliaceum]
MAMGTARRMPLVSRRRQGFAVVSAAAPRLIVMLLAVAAMASSSVAAAAGSPEVVELTLLANAREKGAVCLDGSPPGYHLQRGFGSGGHSWIVNLEGGAWCNTTEDCSDRKMTDLGSSKFMKAIEFEGILSNKRSQNPYFYNWNKVDVRYCDGGSFAGDAEGKDRNGTKLFFRGLRIWEAVVEELMGKGLATAKQALLSGCSAGGLAALLHCDDFRARFPQEVPVKCLSDSGFFLDAKDLSGERLMRSIFGGAVQLQNIRKVLPRDCIAEKDPTECFFPAELIKSISTPTFIRNSGYDSYQVGNIVAPGGSDPGQSWATCKADIRNCTSTQIEALHGFRKELVEALEVAQHRRGWGLFIDSCFNHCQMPFRISWHSRISLRLGNKTIAEAVADWYIGGGHGVKEIDCEYPCINPTCSSQLDL